MLMTQMDIVSENIIEKYTVSSKVHHDPGLRAKIISDNQRQYLINNHARSRSTKIKLLSKPRSTSV